MATRRGYSRAFPVLPYWQAGACTPFWGLRPQVGILLRKFFISVCTRRGYSRAFPVSPALGVFQTPNRLLWDCAKKKTPQVRDVLESSKVGFLYLWLCAATIVAAFPFLPHWAFFKRPIATYFPLLTVKAAALRFNAKAIAIAAFKLERFESTSRTRPFWGRVCIDFAIEGRRGEK